MEDWIFNIIFVQDKEDFVLDVDFGFKRCDIVYLINRNTFSFTQSLFII